MSSFMDPNKKDPNDNVKALFVVLVVFVLFVVGVTNISKVSHQISSTEISND